MFYNIVLFKFCKCLYDTDFIVGHIVPDLRLGHVPVHRTRQHTVIAPFQIDEIARMRHLLHRLRIDEDVKRILLVDVLRIAWLVDVPDISHGSTDDQTKS